MVRLILIRHGETDYNLENRYCGFSDPPLNNKGIWQSERLAIRLRHTKIDKVYSSDLKRASETASIIFKGDSIEKVEAFREMNFGIFEGLNYEEVMKNYPKLYRDWIDNPMKVKIPEGEGLKDLTGRVKDRLFSILSCHKDKSLAVVTHGGPIRIILCEALKYSPKMFWQIEQSAGALNIIDFASELSATVIEINDTSHLSAQEAG